jgi:hypothetical protein
MVVASPSLRTGDVAAMQRLQNERRPLFETTDAPLAVLGSTNNGLVIVPLLTPHPSIPTTLAAFTIPDGQPTWRCTLERRGGRALLADLGNGRPALLVGDGHEVVARDAWTGTVVASLACTGLPVAYGDPFGVARDHLITVGKQAIEIWRGGACERNAMQWSGLRGDLWRSGTLGLGPR